MLEFIKNTQGRYDIKGIDDCGFDRNNTHLTGIVLYEGCIGKIIGFILSIFGKAVRQEITDPADPQKKSYVYVNKESFLLMAERNLESIAGRPTEFTSETIQNLVDQVKTAWMSPSFRTIDGSTIKKSDEKMNKIKEFFKSFNENTFFTKEELIRMNLARAALKEIYPYTKNSPSAHNHIDFYLFSESDLEKTRKEEATFLYNGVSKTLQLGCRFFKYTSDHANQINILGFADKFFEYYGNEAAEREKKEMLRTFNLYLADALIEVRKPNYANRTPGVIFIGNRSLFQDFEWNEIHQVLTEYGNIPQNGISFIVDENEVSSSEPRKQAAKYGYYLDKKYYFYEKANLLPDGINDEEKKKILLNALEGIKESLKNFK
jgi:hypothetical protein